MIRIVRAAVEILRLTFARDRLGPAPDAQPPPSRSAHGVLHLLFVSREPLGVDPEPPRARRSLLRTLFAPEKLPLDPEPDAAARRRTRLAALLAPERLDDP